MAEKILLEVEFDSAEAEKRASQLRKLVADLALQRKSLNVAIKQNQKEEARLTQAIAEQQSAIKGLISSGKQNTTEYAKASSQLKALQSDLKKVNTTQGEYFKQLNETENAQKVARRELNLLNREAQATTGSLNQQRAKLAQLNREYDQFRVGTDGTKKDLKGLEKEIKNLTKEITKQEEATGRFQRNVGNYTEGIKEAFASAVPGGQLLTSALAGPAGAVTAVVAGIGAASKELFDLQQRIEGQRKEVSLLTGAIGNELDILTAKTAATSQTFGVDFNETLRTTNAITKELGGSFTENSDAIAAGLAAAGSQGDELLEILKEYPAQFRDSEISASQFVAIATQSLQEGVFSDKGVDAIKEAGLRLREMPQATKDALDGIGLSSKAIEEGLRNGTTTVFDEIQKVSSRLDELPPQSAEVGTAIADIFGGAGEDAGLRYLTSLKDINTSLDETVAESGKFAVQQLELQEVNADLELSFNQLLGGADGFFTDATIGAKRLLADGLTGLISGLEAIINYFIDLYNESVVFRGALNLIIANVKSSIDFVGALFTNVINGFKTLGSLIKAVVTGDFGAIPDIIKKAFSDGVENIKQTGIDIGNNYVEGVNSTLRDSNIEKFSFADAAAKKKAFEDGLNIGKNLNDGLEKGISLNELSGKLSDLQADFLKATSDEERKRIATEIKATEKEIDRIKKKAKPTKEKETPSDNTDLRAAEATNKAKLALVEKGTQDELNLLAEAAKIKRDKALLDEKLIAEEKALIQAEYTAELLGIEDKRQGLVLAGQLEGLAEQEAQLKLSRANDEVTEQEYTIKLLRIQKARLDAQLAQLEIGSAEYLKKQTEIADKQAEIDTTLAGPSSAEIFELDRAKLSLAFEQALISEAEYTRQLIALRIKRAEAELTQLEVGSAAYIAKQAEIQALVNDSIAAEDENTPSPDDKLAELQRVSDAVGTYADDVVANQERIIEAEARRAVQAREGGNATEEQIQREIEARKAQNKSYQVAKAAQKAAAISEILIARAQQISQVQVAAAKIAATFPPPAGPILAGVYIAANVAAAIADTRNRLAEISALEGGGLSTGGERMQITHKGRIVKKRRSYKDGGVVRVPTVALTGEAGAEYVSPNHQIKRYPELFNWLDRDRKSPGVAMPISAMPKVGYAVGGFTNIKIPAYADGGLTARAAQSVVNQELSVQAAISFQDAIENMPAPIVTVEDINAGQDRKAQVDNSANI